MLRISRMPTILTLTLLTLSYSTGVDAGGQGGEVPRQIVGPPIDAVLTVQLQTVAGTSVANALIVGKCKKVPISFRQTFAGVNPQFFSQIDETFLENQNVGPLPPQCASVYPPSKREGDLIITGVQNFSNDGTAIGADVLLQLGLPE
jgi:hypothetical protein